MNYLLLIFSVLAGAAVVLIWGKTNEKSLKLFLAFGGAFLLGIIFLHLVPEIYAAGSSSIGIFILAGFLLQLTLELFSKGIEHGHMHHHHHHKGFPFVLFISLCTHAFIEGIPLEREMHSAHQHLHAHGHGHGNPSLLIGVVLHNIPLSVALTTTFIYCGMSKSKTFLFAVLFSLVGPLGAGFAHYFGETLSNINERFFDISLALVIGMFLHISTTILFETSEGHRFNFYKLISVLLGISAAFISLLE